MHLLLVCLCWGISTLIVFRLIASFITALLLKQSPGYKRYNVLQIMFMSVNFLPSRVKDKLIFGGDIGRSIDLCYSILSDIRELNSNNPVLVINGKNIIITIRKSAIIYFISYQKEKETVQLKPISEKDLVCVADLLAKVECNLNFNNDIKSFMQLEG